MSITLNITKKGLPMSSGEHFKKVCERCYIIISQCRCPSKDKQIVYDICDKCLREETTINNQSLLRRHTMTERELNVLEQLGEGLHAIADALHSLGTNRATSHLGAIELLSLEVKNAANTIGTGLSDVSDSIQALVDKRD